MRLIRISADGLYLFKGRVELDFFAEQRVISDNSDMLTKCSNVLFTNNVFSIVGLNASGKTTLLRLIILAIDILNGRSLNQESSKFFLQGSKEINIDIVFFDEECGICKLSSRILSVKNKRLEDEFVFVNENLWIKSANVRTKKEIFDFDKIVPKVREESAEYLKPDTSIVVSLTKYFGIFYTDLVNDSYMTDLSSLYLPVEFPLELIRFLDPTIEYINIDEYSSYLSIKFFGKDAIKIPNSLQLRTILSSGTIKGINLFLMAILSFNEGGYLLVDELENHFNKEIVATLIRFYCNPEINKSGATLVFSTHYPELLDEFERTDSIYISRNIGGITAQKLNTLLDRNDIKKSEAYKSDYLNGTAPSYDAYIELKKALIKGIPMGVG